MSFYTCFVDTYGKHLISDLIKTNDRFDLGKMDLPVLEQYLLEFIPQKEAEIQGLKDHRIQKIGGLLGAAAWHLIPLAILAGAIALAVFTLIGATHLGGAGLILAAVVMLVGLLILACMESGTRKIFEDFGSIGDKLTSCEKKLTCLRKNYDFVVQKRLIFPEVMAKNQRQHPALNKKALDVSQVPELLQEAKDDARKKEEIFQKLLNGSLLFRPLLPPEIVEKISQMSIQLEAYKIIPNE